LHTMQKMKVLGIVLHKVILHKHTTHTSASPCSSPCGSGPPLMRFMNLGLFNNCELFDPDFFKLISKPMLLPVEYL
jgi:hypothetical protein